MSRGRSFQQDWAANNRLLEKARELGRTPHCGRHRHARGCTCRARRLERLVRALHAYQGDLQARWKKRVPKLVVGAPRLAELGDQGERSVFLALPYLVELGITRTSGGGRHMANTYHLPADPEAVADPEPGRLPPGLTGTAFWAAASDEERAGIRHRYGVSNDP